MTYSRFGTYNAVLPKGGPKTYPFTLDFTTSGEQELDFSPEITNGNIEYISGVYFDNRKNPNPLEIFVGGSGQSIGIPAGKQGYMPLLITDSATVTFRTPQANGLYIPVHIVNFPVWPFMF